MAMQYNVHTLTGDLLGGIAATVVTLPFALAFGIASGLGAVAGIYGAIAVGFFAAVFGSSRTVISGPAPSVTIAMAAVVTSYSNSLSEAFTVVILAGLLQVLLGLSRIGRYIAYTPSLVIAGLMSGIGVIVILIQVAPFLGAPVVTGGAIGAIKTLPFTLTNINGHSMAIGTVTLAVAVLWRGKIAKLFPGPFVALVAGTLLGILLLSDTEVIGTIPTGVPVLQLETHSWGFLIKSIEPALIIALLSSIDSLLAGMVANSRTGFRHNPSRDLLGQGIGNTIAGVIGGLPGAGASVSTVTNIQAGGQTRVSSVVRALVLILLLLGFGKFMESIPLAVLAAILIYVGWNLIDWQLLKRVRYLRIGDLVVFMATLLLTVFVDLITAGAVGLIIAGMNHARNLEQLELDSVVSVPLLDSVFLHDKTDLGAADPYSAQVGLLALKGDFTVASSNKLYETIGSDIKDHDIVILDFSQTRYLDHSAARLIGRLMDIGEAEETVFIFMGLSDSIRHILFTFGVLDRVPVNRIVEALDDAKSIAKLLIQQTHTS